MLKFLLGDTQSVLPIAVLVVGVAFFVLVAYYVLSDGRLRHRERMESLPLEGDRADG